MAKPDFSYQAEKFHVARSAMMLPHSKGEADSLANAFHACSLGMMHFDDQLIEDDEPRRWFRFIRDTINVPSSTPDPDDVGLWFLKAQQMSSDERYEFARAVDELASWFDRG